MRWFITLAVLVLTAAAAGCGGSPQQMTVHGTVEIAVQSYFEFTGQYRQLYTGEGQVTVTDANGVVIGSAPLDGQNAAQQPSSAGETLTYGFTVTVPEGESFYGIGVSGIPDTVHFSQAQMKTGPALCVGDNCP